MLTVTTWVIQGQASFDGRISLLIKGRKFATNSILGVSAINYTRAWQEIGWDVLMPVPFLYARSGAVRRRRCRATPGNLRVSSPLVCLCIPSLLAAQDIKVVFCFRHLLESLLGIWLETGGGGTGRDRSQINELHRLGIMRSDGESERRREEHEGPEGSKAAK